MLRRIFQGRLVQGGLVLAFLVIYPVAAQEGHPLTGTWHGDWGSDPNQRTQLTFVLTWDGKEAKGVINPGPDSTPVGSISLDPTTWTVRIEGDVKDQAGKSAHVVAEGKMADIASYHRTISGTWTQGTAKGNFKLTRE